MQVNLSNSGRTVVLQLEGAFVFGGHRDLRAVCRPILDNPNTQIIQLELSRVEYLDSSALGMMLLMKERALLAGKEIQIKGAQGMVLQVLEVAKFDRLFTLLH